MKLFACLVVLVGLSGCATTTQWVGHPMTAQPDQWFNNGGYLVDYEIGFRSDGVVVWRAKARKAGK